MPTASGAITVADVTDGTDGVSGDTFRTIYLYHTKTGAAPAAPSATQGFTASTGAPLAGTYNSVAYTLAPTTPASGETIYVAAATLVQTAGTGDYANDGSWTVGAAGAAGGAGEAGPRFNSRRLYISASSLPTAPSATITWATGALSSITSGWSEAAPTFAADGSTVQYFSDLLFINVAADEDTTTVTGSTPTSAINFSGVVTFDSGDFSLGGSPITTIDGGNITTGAIAGGTIPDADGPPEGTEEGSYFDLDDGKFVVGDAENYMWWNGSVLDVSGEIHDRGSAVSDGQKGTWGIIPSSWNSTNQPGVTLDGAGRYRFILIGGGGGGSTGGGTGGTGRFGKGGGAGGYVAFDYEWDGSNHIQIIIGTAGGGGGPGSHQATSGNATSFFETTTGNTLNGLSASGGAGAGRRFANTGLRYANTGNLDTDNSNTGGGSGGGGFAWTTTGNIEQFTQNNIIPAAGFFTNVWSVANNSTFAANTGFRTGNFVFRQGGRGGDSNQQSSGAGGGTVAFWSATNTRNGTTSNTLAFGGQRVSAADSAGAGGSLWGRTLNTGNVPNSTTRHSLPATQFALAQVGVNNNTVVQRAGVVTDFGPFFGYYPAGSTQSAVTNSATGTATATTSGFGVGGATAWSNTNFQSPGRLVGGPGGVLAGGGGAVVVGNASTAGFFIGGGTGNTGGGGGGCGVGNTSPASHTMRGGSGGNGIVYWLKY